jgi:hypothetical protein
MWDKILDIQNAIYKKIQVMPLETLKILPAKMNLTFNAKCAGLLRTRCDQGFMRNIGFGSVFSKLNGIGW